MKTWTAEWLTVALPVEQECKYLQFQQLTDCTLRRRRHFYKTLLCFSLFSVSHRWVTQHTVDSLCRNFWIETGFGSRISSTASFQKQEQLYCHLVFIHGCGVRSLKNGRSSEKRGASQWWNFWTQMCAFEPT